MKSWAFLFAAIVFELIGTASMKLSEGFTRLWPSILIFVGYGLSFVALTLCLKQIDVGIAYAVWAGLGTALIAVIGAVMFEEPVSSLKIVSLLLIIVGVVGLSVSGGSH